MPAARSCAERTTSLESLFARQFGFRHAVAVSTVRYALYATLRRLSLPPGSEILCTPITLASIVDTLVAAGLVPVFVDLRRGELTPDLEHAEARTGTRTRAMLLTHLWGIPADAAAAARFCREHGLALLEDASQCLGASIEDRPVGSFGTAGMFSFSATKTVLAFHGGMLVSGDGALTAQVRGTRDTLTPPPVTALARAIGAEAMLKAAFDTAAGRAASGAIVTLLHRRGGSDFLRAGAPATAEERSAMLEAISTGFADLQAQVALETLPSHEVRQQRRSQIAMRYRRELSPLGLRFAPVPTSVRQSFWMAVAFHPRAGHLRRALWQHGRIDTVTPGLDLCSGLFGDSSETPAAAELLEQAFYLPAYPEMSEEDVDIVIAAASGVLEALR
jgi:dTDP-4-amino-4,6-dideoxygalactose transaminase